MNGYRLLGHRKASLLKRLNEVTKSKGLINIKSELNRIYPNRSIKSIPESLSTKELTGLISYIKGL